MLAGMDRSNKTEGILAYLRAEFGFTPKQTDSPTGSESGWLQGDGRTLGAVYCPVRFSERLALGQPCCGFRGRVPSSKNHRYASTRRSVPPNPRDAVASNRLAGLLPGDERWSRFSDRIGNTYFCATLGTPADANEIDIAAAHGRLANLAATRGENPADWCIRAVRRAEVRGIQT